MSAAVLVSTTPNIEGKKITSYRGVVTGEAIMGANIFKDVFAGPAVAIGGPRHDEFTQASTDSSGVSSWEAHSFERDLALHEAILYRVERAVSGSEGSQAGPSCGDFQCVGA